MAVTTVRETPNPQSRRFMLDRPVQQSPRGRAYDDSADPQDPLAAAILAVPGVAAILTLPDSITVTKSEEADWADLAAAVTAAIEAQHS